MNNQVRVLPSVEHSELPTSNFASPLETFFDLAKKETRNVQSSKTMGSTMRRSEPQFVVNASYALALTEKNDLNDHYVIEEVEEIAQKSDRLFGLSPGQQVNLKF